MTDCCVLFDLNDHFPLISLVLIYWHDHIWASTRENLSSGFPKKGVSNQSPQLQGLARKLKFHVANLHMILSTKLITKALIRLCGCPGCLRLIGPQTSEDRFSHVKAHLKIILPIWKGLSEKQTVKALIRLLLWSSLI